MHYLACVCGYLFELHCQNLLIYMLDIRKNFKFRGNFYNMPSTFLERRMNEFRSSCSTARAGQRGLVAMDIYTLGLPLNV